MRSGPPETIQEDVRSRSRRRSRQTTSSATSGSSLARGTSRRVAEPDRRRYTPVPRCAWAPLSADPWPTSADVVEPWWCPVCNGPAHRTRRPGRPKLYCSNACRQRAYRWRRDHQARTVARPGHPAAGARAPFGRWHALRTGRDFVAELSDRRHRQPTVCGAFARPARLLPHRTHHSVRHRQSRRMSNLQFALISPPLDPLAPAHHRARGIPRASGERVSSMATTGCNASTRRIRSDAIPSATAR